MAIQILGLREIFSQKTNKHEKKEVYFNKGWRASSVIDLFRDVDSVVKLIPEDMRYNLYYTVADCFEQPGRKLNQQWTMPFDVDGMDVGKIQETAQAVVDALGLKWEETGVVFSGNGVQVLVAMKTPITSDDYFDEHRAHYRALCTKINLTLESRGLQGGADVSVFSPARLMRLPNTLNKKKNKPERMAALIQGTMVPVDFDLKALSGVPEINEDDQISPALLAKFPKPDSETVLSECEFLKMCRAEPAKPDEPELYAALSVVGRLDEPKKRAIEMFQGRFGKRNHGSNEADLLSKMEQAVGASGPRTCESINQLWGRCSSCKHFEKIRSPILIKGEDYIKTKDTGFHTMKLDAEGTPRPSKPCYTDLMAFFQKEVGQFVTISDSTLTYRFTGTHWTEVEKSELAAFAQKHFDPPADNRMCAEFVGLVKRSNLRPPDWFGSSTNKKMNLKNGVLDLETLALAPHSPAYGFRHVLPYDHDPLAVAPRFELFLKEVMQNDLEMVAILEEYMGYALSSDRCWTEQALILYGTGSNGKSKFLEVLKALAGTKNHASVTLKGLNSDTKRYLIDGKLFNIAEENNVNSLNDNDVFKIMVAGGTLQMKKLFVQEYEVENRCKLVIACNDLPRSSDKTDGLYRRMLLIPFHASFTDARGNKDPFLLEKLKAELPGILNIAITGYRRLLTNKRFSGSKVADQMLEEYKRENDVFISWFHDCVEFTGKAEDHVFKSELYQNFESYCEEANESVLTLNKFCRRLFAKIGRDAEAQLGLDRKRAILGVKIEAGY